VDAHNGGLEARKRERWSRVCSPVVADSHHFDEEQDPDLYGSDKSDPDPHSGEKLHPIRIKMMRTISAPLV
jgi:hypothetical protein